MCWSKARVFTDFSVSHFELGFTRVGRLGETNAAWSRQLFKVPWKLEIRVDAASVSLGSQEPLDRLQHVQITAHRYPQERPTPVIGQDHHCRSAASPYRTFMAPRSIVQGPKVSSANKPAVAAGCYGNYTKCMNFLAISGSTRKLSTNTAMLRAMSNIAPADHSISVFDRIGDLPVFSTDLETAPLPNSVQSFAELISRSDGLIISSPEYVRGIPGGLKNAIDWLVSRDEIIHKPIALMHASHRGGDMLAQLRIVLSTVSSRFSDEMFLTFELMKKSPAEIELHLALPENRVAVAEFVSRFAAYCGQ